MPRCVVTDCPNMTCGCGGRTMCDEHEAAARGMRQSTAPPSEPMISYECDLNTVQYKYSEEEQVLWFYTINDACHFTWYIAGLTPLLKDGETLSVVELPRGLAEVTVEYVQEGRPKQATFHITL